MHPLILYIYVHVPCRFTLVGAKQASRIIQGIMKNTRQKRMTEQVDWDRIRETYSPLHVRYPQCELIYQAGTYAAGSYLIADGLVSDQCTSTSTRLQRLPLEILGPGNLVGLEILLDPPSDLHLSSARAVTETNLLFFKRELFLEILGEEDEVRRYCMQGLAKRFYFLKQQPACSGRASIEERMCDLLLKLANACGQRTEDGNTLLPSKVTPMILARLIGLSTAKTLRIITSLPGVSSSETLINLSPEALHLWRADKNQVL